ncbi:MAG: hypothetical protein PHT60_01160 [Acidiphilium sp.]|nr:hypothetical protein [Acidiphilium sp.]MDD4934365.1 hypothetical protein [Acidiphilium sp.]
MRNTPETLSERFAWLMALIRKGITTYGPTPHLAGPLVTLAWARIDTLSKRFMKCMARGPIPARKPRPVRTSRPAKPKPEYVLPRGFNWFRLMFPNTETRPAPSAMPANLLRDMLAEPEMLDLIATNPAIGRILRPLCTLLGIRHPPALQRPERPRKPSPPRPGPAKRAERPLPNFPPITSTPPPLGPGNHHFITNPAILKNTP